MHFLLGTQVLFSKVEINQIRLNTVFEKEVFVNTYKKSVQPNVGFLKEEVLVKSKKTLLGDNRVFATKES